MSVATTTALTIAGLGISTATQLYGAKKASSASRDAAKLQSASVDRAKKTLDDTWGPYVNQGRQALGTLGRLTTPGPGARYAAPDQTGGPPPGAPPPARARGPLPASGTAMPRGATLGGLAGPPPGPQGPPPDGGGGQMVMMEAPDGSGVRPVPASQVERLLQMGARRVG
jgi:hypothetical protein